MRLLVYNSESAAQTAADAMHAALQAADKSYNADAWDVPRQHESTGKWSIMWDDARLKAFPHGAESTRTINQARAENWFPDPPEPAREALERKGKKPSAQGNTLVWEDGDVRVIVTGSGQDAVDKWNEFLESV